jgi:anhydro-N-acetylmuramic acid kinase
MKYILSTLKKKKTLCVAGLMSGTSADGIDVAIINLLGSKAKLLAFDTIAYPAPVRKLILSMCAGDKVEVGRISDLNVLIGHCFGEALVQVAKANRIALKKIDLIGSHGQTVHHNPTGRLVRSTLQLGEAAEITQRTGITTVSDFRPADIAAGGQGAPLVSFADSLLLRHPKKNRVIQNIGGIANATYLPAGKSQRVIAFDTGPGNMILDQIVSTSTRNRQHYDSNGNGAKKGQVSQTFLRKLLKHNYFKLKPPKTTGRETFGTSFTEKMMIEAKRLGLSRNDSLATLTALTVESIANAYKKFLPKIPDEVLVCGGGVHNQTMMRMLHNRLHPIKVMDLSQLGIDSDAKEAISFAILARETIRETPNNIPNATGAKKAVVLGKISLV